MKLEVKNLTKKFDKTIAVNNISFKIEKNETLAYSVQMAVEKPHQ